MLYTMNLIPLQGIRHELFWFKTPERPHKLYLGKNYYLLAKSPPQLCAVGVRPLTSPG